MNFRYLIKLFAVASVTLSFLFSMNSCHQEKKKNASFYTINSYPLPVDVTSASFIKKLRIQDDLQGLSESHFKKSISKLPENTFFFLEVDSMVNRDFEKVVECTPEKAKSNTRFELHKKNGKIFLLIFVTYEIATNISELDGDEVKELTVFSKKSQEFNHLALIPIDRILEAHKRKIYLSEDYFIYIMDIAIK